MNAYGAFLSFYDQHLLTKQSDLQLSLVGATESFLLLFPSIFAGRLLDARRHYYLGFTGSLLLFLGYVLLSFAGGNGMTNQGDYGLVWLTSGLLAGLGMTCFFTYSSHNVIQVCLHGNCQLALVSMEGMPRVTIPSGSPVNATSQPASHQLEPEQAASSIH